MALLDEVAAQLIAQGAGVAAGSGADWTVFIGYLQDQPDRAICLYESPGEVPETNWLIDRPHFQVRVRGKADDYQAVRAQEQKCFLALQSQEAALTAAAQALSPPGPTWIYCMAIQSGVIPLGQDEKRRPSVARNYRTMRDRET